MKSYIRDAQLDIVHVKAALDEQMSDPLQRNPEMANNTKLWNRNNTGGVLSVVKPSAKALKFIFAFPIEEGKENT